MFIHYNKILIVSMIMTVFIGSAAAKEPKWKLMGETDNYEVFIDTNNITRKGSVIRYWSVLDYKNEQQTPNQRMYFISRKSAHDIDCDSNTETQLYFSLHDERKGQGNVVISSDAGDYKPKQMPIPPGTVVDANKEFLCSNY